MPSVQVVFDLHKSLKAKAPCDPIRVSSERINFKEIELKIAIREKKVEKIQKVRIDVMTPELKMKSNTTSNFYIKVNEAI